MSREDQTVEQARAAFLGMGQQEWDAMMVESRGGMFLTPVEQQALGEVILERAKRAKQQQIALTYGQTWEAEFRGLAVDLGLEIRSCSHDPNYGWTVLLADGREIEARSTVGVRRKLRIAAAG